MTAVALLASGRQHTPQPDRGSKKYGVATGADEVLSAVYDSSSNSLRVEGNSSSSTSIGLVMPSTFAVSGSPVISSGTISVNWAQPVSIANGGTGATSASTAFNALAPPTAAGGLIYGTGVNTYGNLMLGSSGQCLGSNGASLVWTACSPGSVITLGGDLGGTLSSQVVVGLQGHAVSGTAPAGGQVLEWNSSANAWAPATLSISGTSIQTNGTNNLVQGVLNLTNGSNISFSNASGGTVTASVVGPLPAADLPAISLAASGSGGVTGTLPVSNGGTGLTTVGASGQCLGSSGTAMVWTSCGSGGAIAIETNGANNASQTALNLVAGSNITLTNTSGGSVTISAASGSLPASWSVTGGTNAVVAQPAAGQDATALTLAPAVTTGGSADIFDVCSAIPCSSGSKYLWVTFNGNLGFSGNSLEVGSPNQATQSYLRLYGGSTPSAPAYFDLLSSGGGVRTDLYSSTSTAGVACVGSSIPGGDCGPSVASTNYLISAAGGTPPVAGDCVKWISSTQIGDTGAACGSGSGSGGGVGPLVATPSATQTITAASAIVTPLVLKGAANQTADLFDLQNSSGSNVFQVQANGAVNAGYFASETSIHAAGNFVLDSAGGHFDNAASNSDAAGTITISAGTSASHTFASAYGSPPVCVLTPTSNPGATVWWVTTTTTTITANISTSGTIAFNYVCMGNPN